MKSWRRIWMCTITRATQMRIDLLCACDVGFGGWWCLAFFFSFFSHSARASPSARDTNTAEWHKRGRCRCDPLSCQESHYTTACTRFIITIICDHEAGMKVFGGCSSFFLVAVVTLCDTMNYGSHWDKQCEQFFVFFFPRNEAMSSERIDRTILR